MTSQLQRFRQVTFASELIEREVTKLQLALRLVYFRLRRRQIGFQTCIEEGNNIIYVAYNGMLLRLQEFLAKYMLQFAVNDASLVALLGASLLVWRNIVSDTAGVVAVPPIDTGVTYHAPVVEGYWQTHNGILKRVDLLGQDFPYALTAETMKVTAQQNSASGLKWILEEDERTCIDCLNRGYGGLDGKGFYPLNELPDELPPLHPNCRCQVSIILQLTVNVQ